MVARAVIIEVDSINHKGLIAALERGKEFMLDGVEWNVLSAKRQFNQIHLIIEAKTLTMQSWFGINRAKDYEEIDNIQES